MITESPKLWSSIYGAALVSNDPIVMELTPDKGVLEIGAVLSLGLDGKLVLTTAGNEDQAYGILLDMADTSIPIELTSYLDAALHQSELKMEAASTGVTLHFPNHSPNAG